MPPTIRTYAQAETYLAKGRSKTARRVTSTRHLARVDDDTIALVLHTTAVVTYHRDGTFTIYGGGWNTVTTKRTIADYSPVRIHSHEGKWVVGYTGETTPARVQKCRTCKGAGGEHYTPQCWGPSTWQGQTECQHGQTTRHASGEPTWNECYRCKGAGRTDYGSKPIPVTVHSDEPYNVDANGAFLEAANGTPYAPPYVAAASHKAYAPAPYHQPAHTYGAGIVDELARILPNVRAEVRHPVAKCPDRLDRIIVSLNDTHRWTREQIADWLDTLDLDLRFPASA
jgi:hypothetical protein